MAVGEGRNSTTAHGIRWFSTEVNKNFIGKQNRLKKDKKLSEFEAFSKLADRKRETKSQAGFFANYNRTEFSRDMIRSPVEKPPRIRKQSLITDAIDTRLLQKQSEKLEYNYVVVEETELEKSTRERLIREVKQQNWVENEMNAHQESSLSSPSLSQRQNSAATLDGEKHFNSRSLMSFAPRVQYFNHMVHMDKGEFSKQFCDVLGPGLCTLCTKSQMQQFVIDEHTRSFPDICVSPYVLCVPQESERDIKTSFSIYKECDPLQRRRPSTVSPTHNINGLKTRPNSCVHVKTRVTGSTFDAHCISNESSTQGLEPHHQFRIETPISSLCSSRRSSITRNLMDSKSQELCAREEGSDEVVERVVTPNKPRVRISPELDWPRTDYKDRKSNKLDPNCFSKRSAAPRSSSRLNATRSRSSMCKTPSIERTGKLRELPYWKFLIPEPPMMEVGRMNVSIYTPKQIPGIKIFDETFFDI
ncbi:uncharacterized protein LOC110044718 [Orbicella faveolata]|uniref:uncharacterized protein LOC110044718 n=1 Tax=Orbicella faveolata TaxID=48498 RepID=UPI0009E59DE4|nr:uncharacterized protein LOC110044718 [Orbicella faveolata]